MPLLHPISDARALGRAVRFERKEQGLSQRALAERCGCSQRFISELERGKATAELGKAFAVLGELGLAIGIERRNPAGTGRTAVDQLLEKMTTELERKEHKRPSLADYLEN